MTESAGGGGRRAYDGCDDAPDVGEDAGVHNDGSDDAPDTTEDPGVHNDGSDDA